VSIRTTLILAAVLLVLVGGYWLFMEREQDRAEEAEEDKQVFAVEADAIAELAIQPLDQPRTIALQSPEGEWTITAPFEGITPQPRVWNRITHALETLKSEGAVDESPADLATYGLDEPVLVVDATTRDGEALGLRFGDVEPTGRFRYATRAGDDAVFLLAGDRFGEFNRTLLDLRDRFLVPYGSGGVERLVYARLREADAPAGEGATVAEESLYRVVAEREEDGAWRLIEPEAATADQQRVETLALALESSLARGFVDEPEDLADYGLAPPRSRLTVTTSDGGEHTLYFGAFDTEDPEGAVVYAKKAGEPAVFKVDVAVAAAFPVTPEDFRDAHLLTRDVDALEELRYRRGALAVDLADTEGGWRIAGDDAPPTDQVALSQLISRLVGTEGRRFMPGPPRLYGFEEPAATIELAFADGEVRRIAVGGEVPDGTDAPERYVLQDTGDVMIVPEAVVGGLLLERFDFMDKTLLRFRAEEAQVVAFILDGVDYRFEKDGERWAVRAPEGKAWERRSDMVALLDALDRVEAEDLVAEERPADLSAYGLDAPTFSCTVRVATDDGEETVGPLAIGAPSEAASHLRHAVAAGREPVWLVRQRVLDEVRDALEGLRDI
jgi:hypothetical protein